MSRILKWSPGWPWASLQLTVAACVAGTLIAFAGPWHWLADLFAHFRPQYAVILTVAALVLIVGKQWRTGAVALLGLTLNVAVLLTHAGSPSFSLAGVAAPPLLRVVSLNLLQGNEEFEAVEKFVRGSGADVVVFQEVSPPWGALLQRLTDQYPQHLIRARKDSKGAALLSKLPLRGTTFEEMPGQEQIGAVTAEVQTAAGPVKIFGIHSHKPTRAKGAVSQRHYFQWLSKRSAQVRSGGVPVIVLGDFNSTPWAVAFRQFVAESQLLDTSHGVVLGATWNVLLPHRLMIDHAFISPGLRLVRRQVGPAVGSDHRPLMVDLALDRSKSLRND